MYEHYVNSLVKDLNSGARMAGASVTKPLQLLAVAKSIDLKVMTAYEKEGKTSTLKQNCERKRKLSDRDQSDFSGGLLGRITRIQLRKLLQRPKRNYSKTVR